MVLDGEWILKGAVLNFLGLFCLVVVILHPHSGLEGLVFDLVALFCSALFLSAGIAASAAAAKQKGGE